MSLSPYLLFSAGKRGNWLTALNMVGTVILTVILAGASIVTACVWGAWVLLMLIGVRAFKREEHSLAVWNFQIFSLVLSCMVIWIILDYPGLES